MLRVRQVWVLSYRIAGTVEVYEDYDEAKQAGINYITYIVAGTLMKSMTRFLNLIVLTIVKQYRFNFVE